MGKLTRRDFTKIAAAVSVSTTLGSGRVLGANDRVRLGFINNRATREGVINPI
jgi:hypothetical protein